MDLSIEKGPYFLYVYQRVNSSNIQRWPSPCLVPALDGVSRVLGTSRDISGHGAAAFFRKMQLSAAMGDLQDPIDGGTLVPYFRPYFVGIFPEI